MLRTLNLDAVLGLEATSSSPITIWWAYSSASSSMTGFRALQGAHQVAQKSTSTGRAAPATVVSKFWSVTWTRFLLVTSNSWVSCGLLLFLCFGRWWGGLGASVGRGAGLGLGRFRFGRLRFGRLPFVGPGLLGRFEPEPPAAFGFVEP